jgi:hypothetical protein
VHEIGIPKGEGRKCILRNNERKKYPLNLMKSINPQVHKTQ